MYLPRRASCPKHLHITLAMEEAHRVVVVLSQPLRWQALVGVAAHAGHSDPDNSVQEALLRLLTESVHPALEQAIRLQKPGWEKRVYGWTAQVIRWGKTTGAWAHTEYPDALPEREAVTPNLDRKLDGHRFMVPYVRELETRPVRTWNQRAAVAVAKCSRTEGRPFVAVADEVADATGLVSESIRSEAARIDAEIVRSLQASFAA